MQPTSGLTIFRSKMDFPPTSWTLVRQSASGEETGKAALDELCGRYWRVLRDFAVYSRFSEHDAEDEVQAFLSESDPLFRSAREQKGKLRTFLLTAFRRHLVDSLRRTTAEKRGGGQPHLSLQDEEQGFEIADDAPDLELAFDRRWAVQLVEDALARLQARYKPEDFAVFRPFLLDGDGDYATAAQNNGLSASGFKVGVHRLRKRFREELSKTVSETLETGDDVAAEMAYLLEVLASDKGADRNG